MEEQKASYQDITLECISTGLYEEGILLLKFTIMPSPYFYTYFIKRFSTDRKLRRLVISFILFKRKDENKRKLEKMKRGKRESNLY